MIKKTDISTPLLIQYYLYIIYNIILGRKLIKHHEIDLLTRKSK